MMNDDLRSQTPVVVQNQEIKPSETSKDQLFQELDGLLSKPWTRMSFKQFKIILSQIYDLKEKRWSRSPSPLIEVNRRHSLHVRDSKNDVASSALQQVEEQEQN